MDKIPVPSRQSSKTSSPQLREFNRRTLNNYHFRELEGPDKLLFTATGQRLFLATALQVLQFKMDRKGAEVSSEAKMEALDGGASHFHFDRPFLIYLKKRGAKHPFFVMWVDNAELLSEG